MAFQTGGAVRLAAEKPFNNLLRTLREQDYALIAPHLVEADQEANELLYNPGDNVDLVYFPCGSTLVSFLVSNEDGRDVETILVGREGAVGGIVSHGRLPAYCRIVVKYGGPFVRLPVSVLEAAKGQSSTLRYLFARYADCLLAQMFQSAACNAIHSIEQRAAKWITTAMERTGDHVVPLTQEQLASMLGVGRSYTSRVSSRRMEFWKRDADRWWCATSARSRRVRACATSPSRAISTRSCAASIRMKILQRSNEAQSPEVAGPRASRVRDFCADAVELTSRQRTR